MERIIAFMAVGIAVVAFLCLVAVLAAPLFGVPGASMTTGAWPTVFLIAYFGLPIAFVLVVGLVITRIVQNRRGRTRG